jgi:hypothetical protein
MAKGPMGLKSLLKVTAYTTNTTKNVDRNSQMRVMPGSESVIEPIVMKAGEEAGRHNLKKPAPMMEPMSWAQMNARALVLLMRWVARNAAVMAGLT